MTSMSGSTKTPHSRNAPGKSSVPEPKAGLFSGTLMTFAVGMASGLMLAGLVAFYILVSPSPFVDKGLRKPSSADKPTASAKTEEAQAEASAEPPKAVEEAQPAKPAPPAEPAGTTYYLQVAAFRANSEADQMRARLAILGFEAAITQTRRDGETLYRVRIGPFQQFDELNRVKAALLEVNVESTVIRVLPE
ncbi:MAG: SPOR domain-containing protein [Betaproteobacteria bacterium]|nr:SPOR domain-containing protein [Betaproteobacteria bacterium]